MDNGEFYHIEKFEHPSGLELHSFRTVLIGEWLVRVSASNVDSVVIVMIKPTKPGEFVMGTFTDELEANNFLNFWLDV